MRFRVFRGKCFRDKTLESFLKGLNSYPIGSMDPSIQWVFIQTIWWEHDLTPAVGLLDLKSCVDLFHCFPSMMRKKSVGCAQQLKKTHVVLLNSNS